MSVPGLLEIGKKREVKDSIELIFKLKNKNGLIPRIIDSKYLSYKVRFFLNLIGLNPSFGKSILPTYLSEHGVVSVDGNLLAIIAASAYVKYTSDREQAKIWLPEIIKLIEYIDFFHKDTLIYQDEHSDWQDSLKRKGRVSFVNSLYAIALKEICWIHSFLGEDSSKYLENYNKFINHFKSFFISNNKIKNFENDDSPAIDATLLLILSSVNFRWVLFYFERFLFNYYYYYFIMIIYR
jgi:glycogen debranching enzyme